MTNPVFSNARRGFLLVVALAGANSCEARVESAADPRDTAGLRTPDLATFRPVHKALQVSCGTLDCHGQVGRNLRLFGGRGLRLDRKDNSADGVTTDAEYEASYWSLVGLEPETLSQVISAKGERLSQLSLIRKARGIEKHKGGVCMKNKDPLDVCLVSWLLGGSAMDQKSCEIVSMAPRPVGSDSR